MLLRHRLSQLLLVAVLLMTIIVTLWSGGSVTAQQPAPIVVESDSSAVIRTGVWTFQSTASASGGGYLYNAPATDSALTLQFSGTTLQVLYVSGPGLGSLAIEVDGTVLRTIIITDTKPTYRQSALINYLTDETHTARVYAQDGGVVGVDAFIIPQAAPVETVSASTGERVPSCDPVNVIHRVSISSAGVQGTNASGFVDRPEISADGRFVVFDSNFNGLVLGDNNNDTDLFIRDRLNCITSHVNLDNSGNLYSGATLRSSVSGNGRYVAFDSTATSLVAGDTNAIQDVFVRDMVAGTTIRASVATGGTQATGGNSVDPDISTDGRYIAFDSAATNLVAGDTNGQSDVFVYDRTTNSTVRVSITSAGGQATGGPSLLPSISANGRFVAFQSSAANLVAGDTNGLGDGFVHDRDTDGDGIFDEVGAVSTTRFSVATGGTQATGGVAAIAPSISEDGRYVSFYAYATNLVAGDTNAVEDVFVHDRATTTTTRISVATGGAQSNGSSYNSSISGDGRYITYHSSATNLVAGDTNNSQDVFLFDRTTTTTIRLSVDRNGVQGTLAPSNYPAISRDGKFITFIGGPDALTPGDTNSLYDIVVTPLPTPARDKLALFNPTFKQVNLLDTVEDNPVPENYTAFSAYAPVTGGTWVMGDWNGDGLDTPGVYANGPFYFTNVIGESRATDWKALWIGIAGPPVAGRFNGSLPNDCIGAVQQASLGGQTVFVLYFTCDLSGNTTTPVISNQWLSAVLPDSGGFAGTRQFGAGDFNSDGVDSIAVRRGTSIAFGNTAPAAGPASFDLAQYIGTPSTNDAGLFVVGDWDASGADSFGLFYQNGEFFYRNDLQFNSGVYVNQSVGTPFAGTVQVTTWR